MDKRYANFDVLRGLAILAVVTIHVTASTAIESHTISIILNQVARFGVPVFIFLSGWGLTISDSYQRSSNYFDFLKKRLSKLLPAYVLWNLIYLLYIYFFQGEILPFSEAMQGLLRGTIFPHLYFVPLIILFYIAYPFLLKLGENDWGLLLSGVLTTYSLVSTWGVSIEGFTRNHNPMNWLFYFVFGIWVAKKGEQLKAQLNPTLVLLLLFISQANILFEPLELTEELVLTQTRLSIVLYAIMVILLAIILPEINNYLRASLNAFSKHSYQIYLSHYLFIRLYREWLPGLHPMFLLLSVLVSSYLLAKVMNRFSKIFYR